MKRLERMRAAGKLDGRWLAAGLLLVYFALLFPAGSGAALAKRWYQAGVYAHPKPFLDLQLFPATRATVEAGGDLYGKNPADPLNRSYNYPRVWMTFMRFPASDGAIRALGCFLAAVALVSMLAFWGRLSTWEGLFSGLLLCSPAIQLGVERGNTDQAILAVVAGSLWLAASGKQWRLAAGLLWTAAILKLYPVVAFGAWFEGSGRAWLRRVWPPLVLFAAYLVLTWADLGPLLRNTDRGVGWIQSYGALTLATAAAEVLAFYGGDAAAAARLAWAGRVLAVAGVGWMLLRSRGRSRTQPGAGPADPPALRALLGFRAGALIYIGTFLAGSSFDYRQCFLLLTLPQLFAWRREGGLLPATALVSLFFSLGSNYLLAGWPGFFINEAAGWILLLVLAALLAESWQTSPAPA